MPTLPLSGSSLSRSPRPAERAATGLWRRRLGRLARCFRLAFDRQQRRSALRLKVADRACRLRE